MNVVRGDASVRSHKSVRVHEPHLIVDPSLVQIEMRPLDSHAGESEQTGEPESAHTTSVDGEAQAQGVVQLLGRSASDAERQGVIDANLDVDNGVVNLRKGNETLTSTGGATADSSKT